MVDPTTGEYVGEYVTRPDPADRSVIRRETEWFATLEEARRFSQTGERG
jgi:hypothetical protein